MFNHSIQFSRNRRNDFAIKIFISVLFLCLVCPIRFKIQSAVPITLQSLAVMLVAIWFGWRIGVSAILLYIFLGAVGFHVFADYKSGVEKLWGPTGGFFFGFLVAGYYAGIFVEKIKFQKPVWNLLLWIGGHAIIILIGVIWYSMDLLMELLYHH